MCAPQAAQLERQDRRDGLRTTCLKRLTSSDSDGTIPLPDAGFFLNYCTRLITKADHVGALRQTILDLAMGGRLLAQNPGDEPAAIPPRSSSERSTKVEPELPAGWVRTELGQLGDWRSGSTPSRSRPELYGGNIRWFKSGELNDNPALEDAGETITEQAFTLGSFRMNEPGDVLIAMYGQGATIGRVAILTVPGVTNQAVCACRPTRVISKYLFYFLISQRQNFRNAREGGPQPNISKVKIVRTPIGLPPLTEQHRIVAKVDQLMAVCDELEIALATQEQQRIGLLNSLIRGALVEDGSRLPAIVGATTR
jgi:type I restriction enzyme, S subunit